MIHGFKCFKPEVRNISTATKVFWHGYVTTMQLVHSVWTSPVLYGLLATYPLWHTSWYGRDDDTCADINLSNGLTPHIFGDLHISWRHVALRPSTNLVVVYPHLFQDIPSWMRPPQYISRTTQSGNIRQPGFCDAAAAAPVQQLL